MQLWVFLALLAPLLFAGMNFVDKYLIEKITEESPATVITILAGLAGIPFLIILGLIDGGNIVGFGLVHALGAIGAGLLTIGGYYFYYKALITSEASVVAALFQLIIVFNYILALIFLGEHLSSLQIFAIALVIAGSVSLTIESSEKHFKLNKNMLRLMILASFLIALADVVFKKIAIETSFLTTQFYEYSSGVIAGVFLLVFVGSARRAFLAMMRRYKKRAISVSSFNEVLNLGSLVSMRYAMFLAPVAVVQAVMSVQSLYLIILGVVLTKLFPKIIREDISRSHLVQKIASVSIMVAGTAILALKG